jgi:hypothetical protein
MPRLPKIIVEFHEARDLFLKWLTDQASLIRNQPTVDSVREARANLIEQAYGILQEVIVTALYISADARDHPIVLAKPFGFFDIEVVARCESLQKVIPILGKRLGGNVKCDLCVHYALLSIVEDLGF